VDPVQCERAAAEDYRLKKKNNPEHFKTYMKNYKNVKNLMDY